MQFIVKKGEVMVLWAETVLNPVFCHPFTEEVVPEVVLLVVDRFYL